MTTPNKYAAKCEQCGSQVEAGQGTLTAVQYPRAGVVPVVMNVRWEVRCGDAVQCEINKAAEAQAKVIARESLTLEALTKSISLDALERCCDCARSLKDPVSVEDGIGPICRVKSAYQPNDVAETLRPLARAAVRTIAHFQKGPEVLHALDVVRSLNFPKLAERIEERLSDFQVKQPEGTTHLEVSHKYNPGLYYRLTRIAGRTFDKAHKSHVIPLSESSAVERALQDAGEGFFTYWEGRGLMEVKGSRLAIVATHLDVPTLERMAAALTASSKPACQTMGSQIAQIASGQAANDAVPDWRPSTPIAEDLYAY